MLSIIRRNIYTGIDISGVFITPVTVISSNDGITTVKDLRGNLYSYYGEIQNKTEHRRNFKWNVIMYQQEQKVVL